MAEDPGRTHSAGEEVGRGSRLEQVKMGHNRSSFQVKDNHKQQYRSEPEQHEKLEHRRRMGF